MKRAIFLFPVRKTFVAPIFPLPIFLISPNPDIFVSINPNGIDAYQATHACTRHHTQIVFRGKVRRQRGYFRNFFSEFSKSLKLKVPFSKYKLVVPPDLPLDFKFNFLP